MSQKEEAKELLETLQNLQNELTRQMTLVHSQMAQLSHALIQENGLKETICDIKKEIPTRNLPSNELEVENAALKETINNLKEKKRQHKANYHCLQKTTAKTSRPKLDNATTRLQLSPKTELRRSMSNRTLTGMSPPTERRGEGSLSPIQQESLKHHLNHLDEIISSQKKVNERLSSCCSTQK